MESSKEIAWKKFQIDNDIFTEETLYELNQIELEDSNVDLPWKNNPEYFQKVKISTIALIKMLTHTISEDGMLFGYLKGKICGDTFIILDSIRCPPYDEFSDYSRLLNKDLESESMDLIGMYRSHPGFGCYLGGSELRAWKSIDRAVWVIIDPIRTIATGKVEIIATKIISAENQLTYYSMPISYFNTSMEKALIDILWNKYWIETLSKGLQIEDEKKTQSYNELSKKAKKIIAQNKENSESDQLSKPTDKSSFLDFKRYSVATTKNIISEFSRLLIFGLK